MKQTFSKREKINALFEYSAKMPAIKVGVVCPESKDALLGAIEAAEFDIIDPVLIGSERKIIETAKQIQKDISKYELIDVATEEEAAAISVQLARAGKIVALMKGSLHTDTLMSAIVKRETGLRTNKRMSHCMVVDIPTYHKLMSFTDAAFNIAPNLAEKKDITQNGIDLAIAIGVIKPKVALVSAVETVTDRMPSTIDCAELVKMANNGEITGGIVEGPLAFDVVLSKEAAQTKKIVSEVSGDVDVVVVPNIESGNIIVKGLEYLAGAISFGIGVGAKVPIILTSRSAGAESRLGSCVLAKLIAMQNLK